MTMYVLFTIADNGVKHAFGPFDTRAQANKLKRRFEREWPSQVTMSIHKMLDPDLIPRD